MSKMIKIEFTLTYNQKKRFAFLFRDVSFLPNKKGMHYTIHLDGIQSNFEFFHPIEVLSFFFKFSHEENEIIQKTLINDISIVGISNWSKKVDTMDLYQLIDFEDNIREMLDIKQKSIDETVKLIELHDSLIPKNQKNKFPKQFFP